MRHSPVKCLRSVIKWLLPYCVECTYIRRRYGKAGYVDFLGERLSSGFLRRMVAIAPYGLVKIWLEHSYCRMDFQTHQRDFSRIACGVHNRLEHGEPVRVLFFVADIAMFAAEPLFRSMRTDRRFLARVVAIPDFRRPPSEVVALQSACEGNLMRRYSPEAVLRVCPNENGEWPDVLSDVDIVVYPTPHDFSYYTYCIRYSAGRDVLPVMVNYGFYRSVYDRKIMASENYAHLWMAFFECDATMSEYGAYSLLKGANAEKVGYVKMDALAECVPTPHVRKRILVALHHSVEGGKNDELALATILQRAEFLASLPVSYPEIDFVFRPHPYLVQTLSQPSVWGVAQTEAYIRRLKAMPNVTWSDSGEYMSLFAASDGCIQDCGSYLVEYVYTGKPCCYLLHSRADMNRKFAPLGRKCLSVCYLAERKEEIRDYIERVVLRGEDERRSERRCLMSEIMVEYPYAAKKACERIIEKLRKDYR